MAGFDALGEVNIGALRVHILDEGLAMLVGYSGLDVCQDYIVKACSIPMLTPINALGFIQ